MQVCEIPCSARMKFSCKGICPKNAKTEMDLTVQGYKTLDLFTEIAELVDESIFNLKN